MKLVVTVEGKSFNVEIENPNASPLVVNVDGTAFTVEADAAVESAAAAAPAASGGADVTAPIPGVIQEVNVKEGQTVKKGDVLFVLEAMKMKNNIVAKTEGKVASVNVTKGDSVSHGQVLMSYVGSAAPAPVKTAEKPVAAAETKTAAPAPKASGGAEVTAPIPGVIQEVNVKEGQTVKKGDVLFVLEAMKMKNNIVAKTAGTIASVNVTKGDTVTHGQVLLTYKA